MEPVTGIRLLENEEFIVGIKDSSGVVENLACYAQARKGRSWTLLVGNDRLLLDGLKAGWNGTCQGSPVSVPPCCLPFIGALRAVTANARLICRRS
jgi:dihydrodipicolinate synthase/N-acetylneuraminate lyase